MSALPTTNTTATTTPNPTPPKIAIIGGGLGGLTLAALLQFNHIPFTIYESDPDAHSRNQGGTLDLHPQGGQAALREAGLWDAFASKARPESDVLKVVQNDGTVLWDGNGADARPVAEHEKFDNRPEIDRAVLKELLLAAILPEAIQWGKKLSHAVPGTGLRAQMWDLHFADGMVESGFDLVVGADGAWSRVRNLLTDERPHYSGICLVELWALDVHAKHSWMPGYVGKGNCYSFGEGRTIQIQSIGDGSIRTYACLRRPEGFLKECGIDWTQPATARKEWVERYFSDCGEELKRMVLESDDELVPRTLYQLPVGFSWESRPGVTLLGDAAHLMTPFAGVGVNAAMTDALELAKAIVSFVESAQGGSLVGSDVIGYKGGSDGKVLSDVVREYEAGLFPRGERFAAKTMGNMNKHFSATGSEELAGRLRAAYGMPGN